MSDVIEDLREHLDRLRNLLRSDDGAGSFAAAMAAEAALDEVTGSESSAELCGEVQQLADEALGRAAGLGDPQAAAEVAWRIYCAPQEERAVEAFELATKAAELPGGQYLLGLFRYAGFGCAVDQAASLDHHLAAAEGGLADAMFEAYVFLSRGIGGPADDERAMAWCVRAAEAGSVRAMTNLGGFYATGRGVPLDPAQAFAWYERAAELGHGRAAGTLGVMYATGQGVEPDEDTARQWLATALALGYDPTALIVQCGLDPDALLG